MTIRTFGSLAMMPVEYALDFSRACKWSKASPASPKNGRLFYDIILVAHTVEKGLALPQPRAGFGKDKITALLGLLREYGWEGDPFPLEMSAGALGEYVSWHQAAHHDLEDLGAGIQRFLEEADRRGVRRLGGTKRMESGSKMLPGLGDASGFLTSRYSCRRFTQEVIAADEVGALVRIAQTAPSQCNRQSAHVHCYQESGLIQRMLRLQGGSSGFLTTVRNLFVISSDLTAWSGCNARNQAFVDGALFAMQLSLACHARGLGSCALNLAVGNLRERKIRITGNIPHRERLIMMMAFGVPADTAPVAAHSARVNVDTVLRFH